MNVHWRDVREAIARLEQAWRRRWVRLFWRLERANVPLHAWLDRCGASSVTSYVKLSLLSAPPKSNYSGTQGVTLLGFAGVGVQGGVWGWVGVMPTEGQSHKQTTYTRANAKP